VTGAGGGAANLLDKTMSMAEKAKAYGIGGCVQGIVLQAFRMGVHDAAVFVVELGNFTRELIKVGAAICNARKLERLFLDARENVADARRPADGQVPQNTMLFRLAVASGIENGVISARNSQTINEKPVVHRSVAIAIGRDRADVEFFQASVVAALATLALSNWLDLPGSAAVAIFAALAIPAIVVWILGVVADHGRMPGIHVIGASSYK
jgi:hypothetical protein